jgi:hypothetical protein
MLALLLDDLSASGLRTHQIASQTLILAVQLRASRHLIVLFCYTLIDPISIRSANDLSDHLDPIVIHLPAVSREPRPIGAVTVAPL